MSIPWVQIRQEMVPLAKQTIADFQRHKAQWVAAAIAYFATFAIAPLIIVVVEIAGLVAGQHRSVLNHMFAYLSHTAGNSAARGIQLLVTAAFNQRRSGAIEQIVGWLVFALGATGLFTALQEALNSVWEIETQKRGLIETIRARAISLGVVLAIAFLLLVSIGINLALTVATPALTHVFSYFPTIVKIVDFLISLATFTALFALLFKYLPDCRIEWGDVWPGAAATALLFVVGQFLLGWYVGRAGIESLYGAFGGLVAFLVWVNYSAQMTLLGAEFTHVYSQRYGSRTAKAI
ncbi:MAG: YihY/virulence factor BrkB family protein [Candidatus Baltobacteraceae bacterium]